jgi:hypothetical protein
MASSNHKYVGTTVTTVKTKTGTPTEIVLIPGQTYSLEAADFPRLIATKLLVPTV